MWREPTYMIERRSYGFRVWLTGAEILFGKQCIRFRWANHDAAVTTAQAWIARLEQKQAQGEPMDAALALARRHLELVMAREEDQ